LLTIQLKKVMGVPREYGIQEEFTALVETRGEKLSKIEDTGPGLGRAKGFPVFSM